ncbi:GPP34 family phosphoprotein [Streptomyces sp. NPDC091279]|uniref:GPP34 family phosphoprotein n=1 Tax=unclassified Streptomyces TaxID=2593676 RepID=UPI0037F9FD19
MNTARDLVIVAMEVPADHPVETGDLSLALAGAELLDLAESGAVRLDDVRIVPGTAVPADRRLAEAAEALLRSEPYEKVDDWLWRRGRGLSASYVADLERDGLTARKRDHRISLGGGRRVLADSPERSRAERRLDAGEPLLAALAAEVGIRELPPADRQSTERTREPEETVATVLAAVGGAVTELEGVRRRRAVEDAAYENVWRGL